jgi:hypothetical protein
MCPYPQWLWSRSRDVSALVDRSADRYSSALRQDTLPVYLWCAPSLEEIDRIEAAENKGVKLRVRGN